MDKGDDDGRTALSDADVPRRQRRRGAGRRRVAHDSRVDGRGRGERRVPLPAPRRDRATAAAPVRMARQRDAAGERRRVGGRRHRRAVAVGRRVRGPSPDRRLPAFPAREGPGLRGRLCARHRAAARHPRDASSRRRGDPDGRRRDRLRGLRRRDRRQRLAARAARRRRRALGLRAARLARLQPVAVSHAACRGGVERRRRQPARRRPLRVDDARRPVGRTRLRRVLRDGRGGGDGGGARPGRTSAIDPHDCRRRCASRRVPRTTAGVALG